MRRLVAAALLVAAAVVIEILLPGRSPYHTGWYNVVLAALVVVAIASARKAMREAARPRARWGVIAVAFGALVTGTAGVASGLFAPDDREIVGAPGQRVSVEGLGVLAFPLADSGGNAAPVMLERPLHAPLAIGQRARNAGDSIVRALPRDVVYVEARDLRGNRLTITQPEGTAFLSPVLLMQHHQTISGMDLPFDSFNVPAVRRVVKALLFSPAQAALMLRGVDPGQPAVLFAVDDENDRPLPHAIVLSANGATARAGGLSLRALVIAYPEIEVLSVPNLAVVTIGTLLVVAGIVALAV